MGTRGKLYKVIGDVIGREEYFVLLSYQSPTSR